ncbi:flagellar basal-body rod protein FlgF [Burkholderiaceae bacterium DAT-1]|nr:flagellar basal-body rod protein FlgF [Burkholderiaceae bacterium DAT-1]
MDRLIYVAMTGAKHSAYEQATIANNLANVNTPGFRSQLTAFRAVPTEGGVGVPTRTFVVDQTTGSDFTQGALQTTGRNLDVSMTSAGFLTLQTPAGEAYTRNGSLQLDTNGTLIGTNGYPVIGDGGPIVIPPNSVVTFGSDGTVTAAPSNNPAQTTAVGRMKLVQPDERLLDRGSDGLFRTRDGSPVEASPNAAMMSGALEASNVNPVNQLVSMIASQRQYEMQVQLLQEASQNAKAVSQIMVLS